MIQQRGEIDITHPIPLDPTEREEGGRYRGEGEGTADFENDVTFTVAWRRKKRSNRARRSPVDGRKTRELLLVNGIGERLSSIGAPFPVERGAAANVMDSTVRRGPRSLLNVLQASRRFSENGGLNLLDAGGTGRFTALRFFSFICIYISIKSYGYSVS